MISWVLALRLLKFLSVAAFSAGLLGAVAHPARAGRMRIAHTLATAGFFGTWFAGYGLMKLLHREMREPWILLAMAASLVGLHTALLVAQKDDAKPVTAALALGGGLAAIGAMVLRDAGAGALAFGTILGFVLGGLGAWAFAAPPAREEAGSEEAIEAKQAVLHWFWWIARAEGTSLLLLMFVAMPIRRATGVSIDGGTGLLGWTHGMLVLLFLQALPLAIRAAGWSWMVGISAFVASLFPFGTFAFEGWAHRRA